MKLMKRALIITTLVCFLFSSVCGEALSAVAARPQPASVALSENNVVIPPSAGQITSGHLFHGNQTVINIQDLHCAPEVQHNIGKILSTLDDRFGLAQVYVEGGYGDIDTSWLCDIKDKRLQKEIIEQLVEGGRLTGSEYFSVNAGRPAVLKGIDNERLHKSNLVRLAAIIDKRAGFEAQLKKLEHERSLLEQRYCSPPNRKFNELLRERRQGKISTARFYTLLDKYAASLNTVPRRHQDIFSISGENYPNMCRYLAYTEIVRKIDQRKLALELQGFISELKKKLPYSEYMKLAKNTRQFSDMDQLMLSLGDGRLDGVCSQSFPVLCRYLAAFRLNRECNPVQLISEERNLIAEIRLGLSKDIGELEVSFLSDFFDCFRDYLSASLSACEYDYFTAHFDDFKRLWGKYAYKSSLAELEPSFDLLNTYYAVNCLRDEGFIERLGLDAAGASVRTDVNELPLSELNGALAKSKVIVVVTGGFHSARLTKMLDEKNISWITVTPRITVDAAPAQQRYAELAREQAKLFSTQTISLAIGSENGKLVSVTGKEIVLNINGAPVVLQRGTGTSGSVWKRRAIKLQAGEKESLAAFDAAIDGLAAFLTDIELLANPAQSQEALYRIVAATVRWAAARGIGGRDGLVWEAGDADVQSIITGVEKMTMLEFSLLPGWFQELAVAHAGAHQLDQESITENKQPPESGQLPPNAAGTEIARKEASSNTGAARGEDLGSSFVFQPNKEPWVPGRLFVDDKEAEFLGMGNGNQVFIHPLDPDLVIRVNHKRSTDARMEKEFRNLKSHSRRGRSPDAIRRIAIKGGYSGMIVERVVSLPDDQLAEHAQADTVMVIDLLKSLLEDGIFMSDFGIHNIKIGSIKGGERRAYLIDLEQIDKVPLPSAVNRMILRLMYTKGYQSEESGWEHTYIDHREIYKFITGDAGENAYRAMHTAGYYLRLIFATVRFLANFRGVEDIKRADRVLRRSAAKKARIISAKMPWLSKRALKTADTPDSAPATVLDGMAEASVALAGVQEAADAAAPVPLHWHYINSSQLDAAVAKYGTAEKDEDGNVHVHLYVLEDFPEQGERDAWKFEDTLIMQDNSRKVWASTVRGAVVLAGEGLDSAAVQKAVSETIIDHEDMAGLDEAKERIARLLHRVAPRFSYDSFLPGITLDHTGRTGRIVYDALGNMIVPERVFSAGLQGRGVSIQAQLGALMAVRNAESVVAAHNLYLYLDDLQNPGEFIRSPQSYNSIRNGQLIVDPKIFVELKMDETAIREFAERARRSRMKLYIDLKSDASLVPLYRSLGFPGYLLASGAETKVYDFLVNPAGKRAVRIRGYRNTGDMSDQLRAAQEDGKILDRSEVRRVFKEDAIISRIALFDLFTTALLEVTAAEIPTEQKVREVGYAMSWEALPPLPDDAGSLLTALSGRDLKEVKLEDILDAMKLPAVHPVRVYLEKLKEDVPAERHAELLGDLQKTFVIAVVEKMFAKAALNSLAEPKTLGLANGDLEPLLGRHMIKLGLKPADIVKLPDAYAEFRKLSAGAANADEAYGRLVTHVQMLDAAQQAQSQLIIKLIVEYAEPKLPASMGKEEMPINVRSNKRILSAA